ncbi:MAG: hypothetical protein ABR936_08985 [Bacteroidota bacterium]|jgi:hypothetical protein
MTTKKKIQREPFLFQLIFDLFGPDEMNEVEVEPMTNRELYFFLVFMTITMFIVSYLIKVFTT